MNSYAGISSLMALLSAAGFLIAQSDDQHVMHHKMGHHAMTMSTDSTRKDTAATHLRALAPQTTCPVQGSPIDKKLFVDYKGKRIYVCCEECKAVVSKHPEKYIGKLEASGQAVEIIGAVKTVQIGTLVPQTTCPVMGGTINKKYHVDYKGKRIYVCCPGCIPELKKDPEKYIKKLEAMGQSVETVKPEK
jgi:YHS domain-containing protein